MFHHLKRELRTAPVIDLEDVDVPEDPQEFYEKLGLLENPKTSQPVPQLTGYQYDVWKAGFRHKYRLIIKSQKIGLSTSVLMEDFQRAILPTHYPISCRGKEILIISQTQQHATLHIYTLRKLIANSRIFSKFLIRDPLQFLFRDEVTKARTIFIHNPEKPNKPTRIIGLGSNEGAIWSWKEVKHIHMSDVAATNLVDDSGLFAAAFSRLANTNGSMIIESPPKGQRGKLYEIYKMSKIATENPEVAEAQFKIFEIPYREAIAAGVTTEEFIAGERIRLGPLFSETYECQFLNPSNQWYTEDMFHISAVHDYEP